MINPGSADRRTPGDSRQEEIDVSRMTDMADPFGDPDDDGPAPVVTAGFDGACTECPVEIEEGDDIRSDGTGGWVHADCVEWA